MLKKQTDSLNRSMLSGHEGFTLIEIVMVLVLLGILAAIAAAKFFDLCDAAERAAAKYSAAEAQARLESTFGQKLLEGMPCAKARTYASNLEYLADDDKDLFGDFRFKAADEQDGTQALTFCRDDDECSDWKDLDYRLILPVCMEDEGGTSGNGSSSISGTDESKKDESEKDESEKDESETKAQVSNMYNEFLKIIKDDGKPDEQTINGINYKWETTSNGKSDNKRTFTATLNEFEVEIVSKGNDNTPNEVYIKNRRTYDTSDNLLNSPKPKEQKNKKTILPYSQPISKHWRRNSLLIRTKQSLSPYHRTLTHSVRTVATGCAVL